MKLLITYAIHPKPERCTFSYETTDRGINKLRLSLVDDEDAVMYRLQFDIRAAIVNVGLFPSMFDGISESYDIEDKIKYLVNVNKFRLLIGSNNNSYFEKTVNDIQYIWVNNEWVRFGP